MKVCIHLDINGTILACDPSCGLTTSGAVSYHLASLVHDHGRTGTRFLRLFDGPADHDDGTLVSAYKAAEARHSADSTRDALRSELSRFCESPCGTKFSHVLGSIVEAVGGSEATPKRSTLAAFWRLLDWLQETHEIASWTVFLRTYGSDLGWILHEIESFATGRFPVNRRIAKIDRTGLGSFGLKTPDDLVLTREEEICSWFDSQTGVIGVEDDYEYWHGMAFRTDASKPIWFTPGSRTMHVLFDDNVRAPGSTNSVADLRIKGTDGKFFSAFSCEEGKVGYASDAARAECERSLVVARLYESSANVDYFVHAIRLRAGLLSPPFVRTGTARELRGSRIANYSAWGAPKLQPERYLEREATLGREAFCYVAEFTGWVLSESPWKNAGARVLSTCETYRWPSLLDGRPGHSYGIASVFTTPENRGKGYAVKLISQLVEHLGRVDPLAQAVVLYSDVDLYYRRCGFTETTTKPEIYSFSPLEGGQPGEAEVFGPETCREEFNRALDTLVAEKARFVILPIFEKLGWLHTRDTFYIKPDDVHPARRLCGAKHVGAWCFWEPHHKDSTLDVVLLVGNPSGFAAVVREARVYCAHVKLPSVRIWKDGWLAHGPWVGANNGTVTERECSIPMLAPLKKGLTAHDWAFVPQLLWI